MNENGFITVSQPSTQHNIKCEIYTNIIVHNGMNNGVLNWIGLHQLACKLYINHQKMSPIQ